MELVRLSLPLLRVGRGCLFSGNVWPDFRVFGIQQQPFLKPRIGVRLDGVDRAFRLADPAIDAFVRMDDEHVLAFVEAVHRAHVDAVHNFAANATLVDVCPVDCFYEGENMLVIHPDECIDCGVCEPECPVDAIKPDTESGLEKWLSLNAEYAKIWPNITAKKAPPPDSKDWEGRSDKLRYFSPNPGEGD